MMSDFELLGIPHQVIIGDRALDQNEVEYRHRADMEKIMVGRDTIEAFLQDKIKA